MLLVVKLFKITNIPIRKILIKVKFYAFTISSSFPSVDSLFYDTLLLDPYNLVKSITSLMTEYTKDFGEVDKIVMQKSVLVWFFIFDELPRP